MRYPRLDINVRKLEDNARVEVTRLAAHGVTVMGVNKVFGGLRETADALVRAGIEVVAESRVENLRAIRDLPCQTCLLRSPAPSEVEDVVRYADISLNSERDVLEALSREATRQARTHHVLVMVDMGDLREGLWFQDRGAIAETLRSVRSLPHLEIYGLGTNFSCYGGVLPTVENGQRFVALARELEADLGLRFRYLSGGNCTSYHLIDKGTWPVGINHLRIGGLHQFGIEYVETKYLDEYHHSSMPIERVASNLYLLRAEVIETSVKPTLPVGERGLDAFLERRTFVDRGPRRRALLALGRQDVPSTHLWPVDPKVTVLGQTSDHTLVDTHDCDTELRVGDLVTFELDYTALLMAGHAPGITKAIVRD
jgi:predicted amino acid racemase